MRFLKYCYELDLDLNSEEVIHFGDGSVHEYILQGKIVAVQVSSHCDLFCLFEKDNGIKKLTPDYAITFAVNITEPLQATIRVVKCRKYQ